MKVALCLAGHMRSYERTIDDWKANIIQPLNADVFIHSWKRTGPWVGNFGNYSKPDDPGTIQMKDEFINEEAVAAKFDPRLMVVEDYFPKGS